MQNIPPMSHSLYHRSTVSWFIFCIGILVPFTQGFAQQAGIGESMVTADFNNDGYDDLAVGNPFATVDGNPRAGQVTILFSNGTQIKRSRHIDINIDLTDFFWGSITPDGQGDTNDKFPSYANFGYSLAVGDFNEDQYPDLAIGAPGAPLAINSQREPFKLHFGAVAIVPGGPNGLNLSAGYLINAAEILSHATTELAGTPRFGHALAAPADEPWLAVGAPSAIIDNVDATGAVIAIRRESPVIGDYLSPARSFVWHQGLTSIPGNHSHGDWFGASLAISDLNNDDTADLIIGSPNKQVSSRDYAGAVYVLYNSFGTSATLNEEWLLGTQIWHQDSDGILDNSEFGDGFGTALAPGDFNGDGVTDLAIGVPGEGIRFSNGGTVGNAGRVAVLFSSAEQDDDPDTLTGGLTAQNESWNQDSPGVGNEIWLSDKFGSSLAAGDLTGDGIDDLAIGVPFEESDELNGDFYYNAGAVHLLPGTYQGLTTDSQLFLHRALGGVSGSAGENFFFGKSLAIGRFNAHGTADLAIGTPGMRLANNRTVTGAVNFIYARDGIDSNQVHLGTRRIITQPMPTTGPVLTIKNTTLLGRKTNHGVRSLIAHSK